MTWARKDFLLHDLKYLIRTYLMGYPAELQLFLASSATKTKKSTAPKTKFCIFSSGRSGSTLLLSLLNKHPSIDCKGELLKSRFIFPAKVIKFQEAHSMAPVFGFKLLSYQLRDVQSSITDKSSFLKSLFDQNFKIIYLERTNRLNQVLSLVYAMARNKWHSNQKGTNKRSEIYINPELLLSYLKAFDETNSFEHQMLESIPDYFYINYERDLVDPEKQKECMEKLFHYLSLEPCFEYSELKKITPKDHQDYILNFREIKARLEDTDYVKFI